MRVTVRTLDDATLVVCKALADDADDDADEAFEAKLLDKRPNMVKLKLRPLVTEHKNNSTFVPSPEQLSKMKEAAAAGGGG